MRMLVEYEWPGNVRELENTIERAIILSQGGIITEDLITFSSADQGHFIDISSRVRNATPLRDVLHEVERQMIREALRQSTGDRIAAATVLGLDIDDLNAKLSNYGIPVEAPVL
jgi:DNA-binding NtrC family response regulator